MRTEGEEDDADGGDGFCVCVYVVEVKRENGFSLLGWVSIEGGPEFISDGPIPVGRED